MKKYKHLSQEEYDRIKKMTDAGLTPSQIKAITGRSSVTAGYIKRSTDMDSYYEISRSYARSKNETTPGKRVVSKREERGKRYETVDSSTIALLTRIAIALEKMEQHWQPTDEKKRFKFI